MYDLLLDTRDLRVKLMRKATVKVKAQRKRIMKLESDKVILNEQINTLKYMNQVLKEK